MNNITSIAGLKNAIQLLEAEQTASGKLLKEQFQITYEGLKPVSLIRSMLNNMTSSPYLIENIAATAIGLASGYLTNKIVVSASGNLFRRLIGSVLQFGVTNIVARHPGAIRFLGRLIFQPILKKRALFLHDRSE